MQVIEVIWPLKVPFTFQGKHRELDRAAGLDLFCVVVEATWQELAQGQYRSRINPHAACQSILAFTARYRIPFHFAGTRAAAEYCCYSLLRQYLQGAKKRLAAIVKAHGESDDDEKGIINADTLGGSQEVLIISESGLYSLILRLRKLAEWIAIHQLGAIFLMQGASDRTRELEGIGKHKSLCSINVINDDVNQWLFLP